MRGRSSRRHLARYLAAELEGTSRKTTLRRIAAYLIDHRATKEAPMLVADVAQVLADQRRHLLATATVARPLQPQVEQILKSKLAKDTNTSSVELEVRVDPDLIGGVILETPDTVQDASVRTALKKLQAIT